MKKSEVLACCNEATKVTFKNVALKVGDIYSNTTDGTLGIVLKFGDSLIFKKHDGEYVLPENKNSMFNHEFVCNVSADANMLQQMINCGYIEDDNIQAVPVAQPTEQPTVQVAEQEKEEKPKAKKTAKKEEKPKVEQTEPKLSIYEKINKVREAWKNANIEKDGRGKAGGGAKYEYYKPQQIIDFCLEQELKLGLVSNFTVNNTDGTCYYRVINIDDNKDMITCCPFVVPKKMACSEAQQVGAALTYYNRRLAMMLYKIEDNSRESVDVMENADYSAPVIPEIVVAPPIMQTPPVAPPSIQVPPQQNVQPEPPSMPNNESKVEEVQTVAEPPKNVIPDVPQAEKVAQQQPTQQPVPPVVNVPPVQPQQVQQVPQAPVTPPVAPTKPSIESLY